MQTNRSLSPENSYNAGVCHHFGFPNPTLCNECIETIQARAEEDDEDEFKHKRRRLPSWIQPVYSRWEKFDATNFVLVILLALAVVVLLIPTYYHSAVAYRNSRKHTVSNPETLINGHAKRNIGRSSDDAGAGEVIGFREDRKVECQARETTFTTTVTITSLKNHTIGPTETKTVTKELTVTITGIPTTVTVFTDPPKLKKGVFTAAPIHILGVAGAPSTKPSSSEITDYNLSIDKTKHQATKVSTSTRATSTRATKSLSDGSFRRPS